MRFLTLLLLSSICFVLQGAADPGDIRVLTSSDTTRIIIETDRDVSAKAFPSSNGDIRQITIGLDKLQAFASTAKIMTGSGIQSVQTGDNRVVFTLDRPLHIRQIKETPPTGDARSHRIIIDLIEVSAVRFDNTAKRDSKRFEAWLAKPLPTTNAEPAIQRAAAGDDRMTIVIDAGHGGRDPGTTISPLVQEKFVVLETALVLRDLLADNPDYNVRLVRSTDIYVDHDERVTRARDWGADLFISLHADSVGKPEIFGAAVYTLNQKGQDRILDISRRNQWEIPLETGEPVTKEVGGILDRLTIRETLSNSAQFANLLVPELGKTGPILRNSHREANFFVLLAPDVPAVLIELGFLSNKQDAKRLASKEGRKKAAIAIERAIDKYFASRSGQFVKN